MLINLVQWLSLLGLGTLYLRGFFLPLEKETAWFLTRRDKQALVTIILLSWGGAEFVRHSQFGPTGLYALTWAMTPGIAAGTAGRKPWLYLLVSSVTASLVAAARYLVAATIDPASTHTNEVLFVAVAGVISLVGWILLIPLLLAWRLRRERQQ